MIHLKNIESVISLITLFLAYLIAIVPSGYFRAWMAKQFGDDTPEHMGFLTWNPIAHIDPFGIIFLFLLGFGWGRYIPINPNKISHPYHLFKLIIAYFSDVIAQLGIALIALVFLIKTFGLSVLILATPMILSGQILLPVFSSYYPDQSSLLLAVALVLVAVIYLCVLLAALHIIVNGFRLIMLLYFHDQLSYRQGDVIIILIPMLLIILFAGPLRYYVMNSIIKVGSLITYLIG